MDELDLADSSFSPWQETTSQWESIPSGLAAHTHLQGEFHYRKPGVRMQRDSILQAGTGMDGGDGKGINPENAGAKHTSQRNANNVPLFPSHTHAHI